MPCEQENLAKHTHICTCTQKNRHGHTEPDAQTHRQTDTHTLTEILSLQIKNNSILTGDGFPAVSEIVQSSSVLSHYTNHSSTIGQWQIFPHISFSCNCSLSGWTFIATYTTPDANTESIVTSNQLQFQIWRRISNISLRLIFTTIISKNNVSSLTTNQKGMSLAVINFDEPVMIQEGDVFGVFQPNSKRSDLVLQFQSGLAPASYVRLTNSPTDVYSMRGTVINQDYPLISAKYQGTHSFLYMQRLCK